MTNNVYCLPGKDLSTPCHFYKIVTEEGKSKEPKGTGMSTNGSHNYNERKEVQNAKESLGNVLLIIISGNPSDFKTIVISIRHNKILYLNQYKLKGPRVWSV